MPVKQDEYNRTCVLSIIGDLAGEEVALLQKHADEAADENQVDFVVDLEKSGFIDSDGLETLLAIKSRCEDSHGQLKLATLDENVKKILEITRLAHRFECHPDLTSALRTMR
jgi:anti-anti-sigma factor